MIDNATKSFARYLTFIFGLSEECGTAIYLMLEQSFKTSSGLRFNTAYWRESINNFYNWKTNKPSTRILKTLEKAELIQRCGRYNYQLNKGLFGDKEWNFVSDVIIEMVCNKNKASLKIKIIHQNADFENYEEEINDGR